MFSLVWIELRELSCRASTAFWRPVEHQLSPSPTGPHCMEDPVAGSNAPKSAVPIPEKVVDSDPVGTVSANSLKGVPCQSLSKESLLSSDLH